MGLTFEAWKAQALGEYMRLSGETRSEAEMYFDHIRADLKDLYQEEALPLDAVKALMFDDEAG